MPRVLQLFSILNSTIRYSVGRLQKCARRYLSLSLRIVEWSVRFIGARFFWLLVLVHRWIRCWHFSLLCRAVNTICNLQHSRTIANRRERKNRVTKRPPKAKCKQTKCERFLWSNVEWMQKTVHVRSYVRCCFVDSTAAILCEWLRRGSASSEKLIVNT